MQIVPDQFTLESNYPNPFNPQTTIRYQIPEPAQVHQEVYDLLGQKVRTLVDQAQEEGYYLMVWDGRDEAGAEMASGIYFCRLQANSFRAVRKLVLMK